MKSSKPIGNYELSYNTPKLALSPLRTTSSALVHPAQITLVRFNRTSQQITLLRAGDELSHPLLKQLCGVRLHSDEQRRRPCSRACHAMLQELLLELDRPSTLSQVDHSLIRNPAHGSLRYYSPIYYSDEHLRCVDGNTGPLSIPFHRRIGFPGRRQFISSFRAGTL